MHRPTLIAIALSLLPTAVYAQWTVTNLHPAGFPNSFAFACDGEFQAGYSGSPGTQSSLLWRGTAESVLNTTPVVSTSSYVRAYANGVFTGSINGATVIWDHNRTMSLLSSNDSVYTSGYTRGAGGTMQVGDYGHPWQAALWTGTPSSLRTLGVNSYSIAYGTDGLQQVGFTAYPRNAALWFGSRETYVNLHPGQSGVSEARAVHNGIQVGSVTMTEQPHASLWRGTATSWVDLHPAGALSSSCLGVFHNHQVGTASFNGLSHAAYWNGTAASFVDLALLLPATWSTSTATAVWSDGITLRIVGHGFNTATNRTEALLWTRQLRTCGTADFTGDGNAGTDADIEAFFACLAGQCCPTCYPGGSDFNADNDHGTDQDIESFFRVLAGAAC
jgi:hypothetical protein